MLDVEASRLPGCGALVLILSGARARSLRQSARTALSWLRANAARYGLDPAFQRDTGVILHVQLDEVPGRET